MAQQNGKNPYPQIQLMPDVHNQLTILKFEKSGRQHRNVTYGEIIMDLLKALGLWKKLDDPEVLKNAEKLYQLPDQ